MTEKVDWPRYWTALGQFVHEFATTETHVTILARQAARLHPNLGWLVLPNLHVEKARSTIEKLYSAQSIEVPKPLLKALDHFGFIIHLRNAVVHNPAQASDDELLTQPLRPGSAAYSVAPETLDACTADLKTVRSHVQAQAIIFAASHWGEGAIESYRPLLDALEADARVPWRYKPPRNPGTARRRPS